MFETLKPTFEIPVNSTENVTEIEDKYHDSTYNLSVTVTLYMGSGQHHWTTAFKQPPSIEKDLLNKQTY